MRHAFAALTLPLFLLLAGLASAQPTDGKAPGVPSTGVPAGKTASTPPPAVTPESEAEAFGFVRENHPELAKVLETLKPMDPVEFGKAIAELLQVSRNLGELKTRNPKRYEVLLESWKAKSRVELIAAQLAGLPSEELRSRLHTAIEAKVEAEIRRQKFEIEQAEAVAKRARETLRRLETKRESIIEARYRALLPKNPAKPKKSAETKPAVVPSPVPPSTPTAHPDGEKR